MTSPRFVLALLTLMLALAFSAHSAEFKKGQKVWSKHVETPLLVDPSPLSEVKFTVGFAEKMSVREVQGSWLRVKSDEGDAWVFQGNVTSDKPSLPPAAGLTTMHASQTNTVAAARPLTPAAKQYAQRHGANDASDDIDWLDAEADSVTQLDVIAFLVEHEKGEYQP